MKNFEIFKKFEQDDNIKNAKLNSFLDDYRTQVIFMLLTMFTRAGNRQSRKYSYSEVTLVI